MQQLTLSKLSMATIGYITTGWRALCFGLAVPTLLFACLNYFGGLELSLNQRTFLGLALVIVGSIVEIVTYRILLLSEGEKLLFTFGKREVVFVLRLVMLSFLFVPAIVFSAMPLLSVVLAGLAIWMFARFSLIFPALSVDQPITLQQAWELTEQHQSSVFFASVILPLLFAIPMLALASLPLQFVILSIASVLLTVLRASALAVVYRFIVMDKQ